jgi:hypothetical protein
MTQEQYVEIVALLDKIGVYSEYMGRSSNADEWQRNFSKYDDARQKVLVILKNMVTK